MKKLRNKIKLITDKFGISKYIFKLYFKLLAIKYKCKLKYFKNRVEIFNNNKCIKIKKGGK